MARTISLSMRAILVITALSFSLGANALPMSPKWMKSNASHKSVDRPGELGDGNPTGGVGPLALPLPGSLWLVLIGVAGIAAQRRNKSTS
jgi:hypothetical protein